MNFKTASRPNDWPRFRLSSTTQSLMLTVSMGVLAMRYFVGSARYGKVPDQWVDRRKEI